MRVNNHLSSYRMQQEMADYNRMMHRLVEDQKNQIEREHANVLRALTQIMKKKDDDKGVHRGNVGYNCRLLAQGMQFSPVFEDKVTDEFVENIGIASRLHDVGRFLMSGEEIADDGGPDRQNLEYIKKCTEFGERSNRGVCGGSGVQRRIGDDEADCRMPSCALGRVRISGSVRQRDPAGSADCGCGKRL